MELRISAEAQEDLDSIGEFIARDSLSAADHYVERIGSVFDRLCTTPGIGSPRNDLMKGLRGRAFGSYIIYYRASSEVVEIVRVVHGARDQTKIFGDPPVDTITQ